MAKKQGCRYGLIIHGRDKPLWFDKKIERDHVAKYLKGLVTISTFTGAMLKNYAVEYHTRDTKKKGYTLYIAPSRQKAREMFKKDFGQSRVIHWIKER